MGVILFETMQYFTFAAILGSAVAQTVGVVNDTPITDAVTGQVSSTGSIGEWTYTEEDGALTAGLYIEFSTACNGCMFANNAVVQAWMEGPSADAPGKVDGMICTANWEKSAQWSVNHQVTNYKDAEPLSDHTKAWNYNYGYVTDESSPWNFWQEDSEDKEEAYASAYSKNSLSRQACRAVGVLYGEKADGTYDEELGGSTGMYWDWKNNNSPFTFTSGFRVYESASDDEPYTWGSAGETTYTLADHGFTDTTPPPAEDDTTTDPTDGSGAAALMASVTALAAFLVF